MLSGREWSALSSSLDLTSRQLEIVKAIFADKSEVEIVISYNTVHTHLVRLYRKLEVHSRSGLILRVLLENGELS